jgi:hypothetical protein
MDFFSVLFILYLTFVVGVEKTGGWKLNVSRCVCLGFYYKAEETPPPLEGQQRHNGAPSSHS